jgi:hypothetical protein
MPVDAFLKGHNNLLLPWNYQVQAFKQARPSPYCPWSPLRVDLCNPLMPARTCCFTATPPPSYFGELSWSTLVPPSLTANSSEHLKSILDLGLTIILITVNMFIMLNTSDLKTQSLQSTHVARLSGDTFVTFGWHLFSLPCKRVDGYAGTSMWEPAWVCHLNTVSIIFLWLCQRWRNLT